VNGLPVRKDSGRASVVGAGTEEPVLVTWAPKREVWLLLLSPLLMLGGLAIASGWDSSVGAVTVFAGVLGAAAWGALQRQGRRRNRRTRAV
jgi:hypothetical protein